jgi:hypothetical protein
MRDVFFVHVDDTLLDNDQTRGDLKRHLECKFGVVCQEASPRLFRLGSSARSYFLSGVALKPQLDCFPRHRAAGGERLFRTLSAD